MQGEENQINNLMKSAIEKIKELTDVSTVVGVPFETKDGTLIIPLTKVSIGFVTGGGEYGTNSKEPKNKEKFPLAGGSGGGVTLKPVGLLQINKQDARLIRVDEKSSLDKLIDTIPSIVSKVTDIFDKGDNNGKN